MADGVGCEVPLPTRIVVRGVSEQPVGEVAAIIRKQRPPEPYRARASVTRAKRRPEGR